MATPTYWADKLVNKIISTRSSWREFLKATTAAGLSVSALGAIGALSGCAGVQPTQEITLTVKSPQEATLSRIKALMWGEDGAGNPIGMSEAEIVAELIKILNKAVEERNEDVTLAAAEGLSAYAVKDIAVVLNQVYNTFSQEGSTSLGFHRYIIQLLGQNFRYNVAARNSISRFFMNKLTGKGIATLIRRETIGVYATLMGLMGYRQLRTFQRHARLWNHQGWELRHEYFAGFLLWPLIASYKDFTTIPPETGAYFTFAEYPERFASSQKTSSVSGVIGSDTVRTIVSLEWYTRFIGAVNDKAHIAWGEGKTPEQLALDKKLFLYGDTDKIPNRRKQLQDWLKSYKEWKEKKNKDHRLAPPPGILALQSIDEISESGQLGKPGDLALVVEVAEAILALPNELPEVKQEAKRILESQPNIDEETKNLLMKYLQHDVQVVVRELKQEALRILGSHADIDEVTRDLLMNHLESDDRDMVRIAAMGLQHKNRLPERKILKILAKKKQQDPIFGTHLEDLLVSSFNSPDAFQHLARQLANTNPKDVPEIRRLARELMLWYLGRGANRDVLVRQTTPGLTKLTQQAIILMLRKIEMMHPWAPMPHAKFLASEGSMQDGRIGDAAREEAINHHAMQLRDFLREYMRNIVVNFSDDRYSPNVSQEN